MEEVENMVAETGAWQAIKDFLGMVLFRFGEGDGSIEITIGLVLLVFAIYTVTSIVLKVLKRLYVRRLPPQDKGKFKTVFSFGSWVMYIIVLLVVLNSVGINVTAVLAASAALLIGVGLALQTLFQDIISGIFILIDQSLHVGDIIEIDDKVGKVEEIKLRTTRAVTIDNKVLVIPNHLYLTNSLYNWTQNGVVTRERISVGVAYGSDVCLVEELLLQAATSHPAVLDTPEPRVIFNNFGDSALEFQIVFALGDSFQNNVPKSDIRFEIDKLFRESKVTIPFPQRDVHIYKDL